MLPRGRARAFFDAGAESLEVAVELYNRPSERGRVYGSVTFMQHALEMFLKAAILKSGDTVRPKGDRLNISFGKAVNVAETKWSLIDHIQAKELRSLEHHRDTAAHDVLVLSEDLLYYTVHGAVDVAVKLVARSFDSDLRALLPERALPVASRATQDFATVVTETFDRAKSLLIQKRSAREESRRTIAALANLEAGLTGEPRPSERDLDAITRRLAGGSSIQSLFPEIARVGLVAPESDEAELFVAVRLGKTGMAVRFAEEGEEATIMKQVDCFEQYPFSSVDLGNKLQLTAPKARALAWHLRLLDSEAYFKECKGPGRDPSPRYSLRALRQMREQLPNIDMNEAWRAYRAAGKS